MLFRVQTCGSGEELTLDIDPQQETIIYIKKNIHLKWGVLADDQALVCCGHALEDDMLLASLSRKIQNSEKIWLTVCKLPHAENKMFPILVLKSIFSLSSDYAPSDLQDSCHCVPMFLKFCQRHSSATASVQTGTTKKSHNLAQDDAQMQRGEEKMGTQDHDFMFRTQFTWRPTESDQRSLRCAENLV
jgi:hypothetical protein